MLNPDIAPEKLVAMKVPSAQRRTKNMCWQRCDIQTKVGLGKGSAGFMIVISKVLASMGMRAIQMPMI